MLCACAVAIFIFEIIKTFDERKAIIMKKESKLSLKVPKERSAY